MKHPYSNTCECHRCTRERTRREHQSATTPHLTHRSSRPRLKTRRPVWGSQEWAETRGDDIDSPSGDY